MRVIITVLLLKAPVALGGELIVIWPGTSQVGTVSIKARVRPRPVELSIQDWKPRTMALKDDSRILVEESRMVRGINTRTLTVTPF